MTQRLGQKVRAAWVRDLGNSLSKVETVVVARVEKVPTRDLNQLRQSLNGSFYVVKNSLCRIAFREKGWADLEKSLEGTCAVSPIEGDVVAAAKLLVQFAKGHEGFVLQGGMLAGQAMDGRELKGLAALPSRKALLSRLAGVMQAPLRGLAFVMNAPIRGFAIALAAVAGKKSAEGGSASGGKKDKPS